MDVRTVQNAVLGQAALLQLKELASLERGYKAEREVESGKLIHDMSIIYYMLWLVWY